MLPPGLKMTDWSRASLTETAGAIAAGRTTSRDVTEACLDRIGTARRHAQFSSRSTGRARAPSRRCGRQAPTGWCAARTAARCAARAQGHVLPGRPGVGLQIEAACRLAGALHRHGARQARPGRRHRSRPPRHGRVRHGPHGYNQNYPQCRNPWNPEYIPCGSSSGSGVAVGGRMVHASLGSDTGGSIRCPAAVSGVVGLVPTNGRVSRRGAMPMSHTFDVVGPLARTARDCARLLGVIAGHDPVDASSLDVPVPNYEAELDGRRPCRRSESRAATLTLVWTPMSGRRSIEPRRTCGGLDSPSRTSPCPLTCSTRLPSCIRSS